MLWNTETEEFNTQNYCIDFLKKQIVIVVGQPQL
jgi:hypothetical protein